MRTISSVLTLSLVAALAAPVAAKTTVISQLGTSPLLGQSSSSTALKTNMARHEHLLESAAAKMGLSASEYSSFRQQIAASHYAWVTVPRHLDSMSWASGQQVHIIRDVMIPAGTNGWEVDLRHNNQILALFMPAVCGNLSLIRKNMPVVARVTPPAPKLVAKVVPAPPVVPAAPAVAVGAPPQVLGVESAPAPPADTVVAPGAVHRASLLPLLLGILPFIGGGGGGGGSSGHGGGGLPVPAPGCGCH